MTDEPPTPQAELMVAVAGPIASVLIAAGAFVVWTVGSGVGWPFEVTAIAQVVAVMNVVLVLFNIVPAFPLDGGRMMRSLLWHWKDNLRWATRVTSSIGSVFGAVLIGVGVMLLLFTDSSGGGWINGIWFALIGLFLRNAARMSYQQLLLRRALEGEPVSRFMQPDPVAVPRAVSVKELVEDYVYRHHYKLFPVVDGDRLVGCVTTREVKGLPREEWDRQTVGSIATACTPENAVDPATDAMQALGTMSRNGISRLMVVDGGRLVGILTLKDLLKFFSLKMELESPA
jgi:CBS domain-containing protein